MDRDGVPRVTDVVLMPSPYSFASPSSTRPRDFFQDSHAILEDVWLARLESSFANAIMDACQVRGENFNPIRQFGAPYGFVRVAAPLSAESPYDFDPDGKLVNCLRLSRLIHPTSIGMAHAARVRVWKSGAREIIPVRSHLINPFAFVVNPDEDWLIPNDVPNIRAICSSFFVNAPPLRVNSALWHLEACARTYFVDIRWPQVVTALESLIHLSNEPHPTRPKTFAGSTQVFVQRLHKLAGQIGFSISESDLRSIYSERSILTHGLHFGDLTPERKRLYALTEDLARAVVRRCIEDSSLAATFASDSTIKAAYPLV